MPLTFIPFAARAGGAFAEVGARVRAVAHDEARSRVAIAWEDPLIACAGRAVYEGSRRHRVGVFATPARTLLATFEHVRFPIHDLAMHPTRPELAIATGAYDGGMYFEGQLLIWNWETGAWHSELRACREVTRVHYRSADELAIVVSPATDEDSSPAIEQPLAIAVPAAGEGDGWVRDGATAAIDSRLDNLPVVARAALGITEQRATLALAPRAMIWDLAWLADGRLAIARDDGVLALWRPTTDELVEIQAHEPGRARITSLHAIAGGAPVIHVETRLDRTTGSILYTLADDDSLVARHTWDHGCATTMDAFGRVLVRDVRMERRTGARDRLLDLDGAAPRAIDCGHYDVFNHALRVDGAERLFFLRGAPPSQHLHKQLCAIEADGTIRTWMAWDDPAPKGPHLMMNSAAAVGDAHIARAYLTHDPRGTHEGAIELCVLDGGRRVWRHAIRAAAIALVHWPAASCVVAALADRTILALDVATGDLVHHEPFVLGGGETVVTAIAPHAEAIAFATIDGRVQLVALR